MTRADGQLLVHSDAAELASEVASRLLGRLETAQADGGVPHVVLTGGSIADEIHREVARRAADSSVDWSRVVLWWGDERFVPADSPDRNARQAREALLDQVPLDPANVHEVPASDQVSSVEEAAQRYADLLRRHGPDELDLVMLGVGPDGHVASLFPGRPELLVEDTLTVPVTGSPKPPPERVSLTFPVLNRSRAVWFVANGEGKAEAVAAAVSATPDAASGETLPAARVAGRQETLWLLDEAAAAHCRR